MLLIITRVVMSIIKAILARIGKDDRVLSRENSTRVRLSAPDASRALTSIM